MMFWDIKNPFDVKTNNIEFKIADKMTDRVAKPANFSAENGNNLFNNVICIYHFLNLIKTSFYSLFK